MISRQWRVDDSPYPRGMAIGFRVGPARIGVNRGRLTGGLRLGPVTVSGQTGGRRGGAAPQPAWVPPATVPIGLAEATAQAEEQGWTVAHRGEAAVWVQRGLRARVIEQHPTGVLARPTLGPRALITGLVALAAVCVAAAVLVAAL